MKTFEHGLTPSTKDSMKTLGYTMALMDLYKYLVEATMGGRKQFIEALPLVELVQNTNAELMVNIEDMEKQLLQEVNDLGL